MNLGCLVVAYTVISMEHCPYFVKLFTERNVKKYLRVDIYLCTYIIITCCPADVVTAHLSIL